MTIKEWPSRSTWEAWKAGEDCAMCADMSNPELAVPGYVNQHGRTIAVLDETILRLVSDQYARGYCVLISRHHGPELHHLTKKQRIRFNEDLALANQAIEIALNVDKINYEVLGNKVVHLHAHIVPRYLGDRSPGARLLRIQDTPVALPLDEEAYVANLIADALVFAAEMVF